MRQHLPSDDGSTAQDTSPGRNNVWHRRVRACRYGVRRRFCCANAAPRHFPPRRSACQVVRATDMGRGPSVLRTKATGVENRPSAQCAPWNTKIALYGKSHQSPPQRLNLSIRVLYNRKIARQSLLRFS